MATQNQQQQARPTMPTTTTAAAQPATAIAPQASASQKIERWMHDGTMMQRISAALSGYLDPQTFAAQCVLAAKDPKLAECSPISLFEAFLVCAQMGLLPGKHHGHVALIPRVDKDRGGKSVDVMPQWQGYKFLMERQSGIKRVTPILVHVSDEFAFDGVTVTHRFDPLDDARQFKHPADAIDATDAGLRGGYLRIEHDDGEIRYHFVTLAKIEASRSCSQTPDLDKYSKPGVWRSWYAEQATKTILRDAWARRAVQIDPVLSHRVGATMERDDAALGNDPERRGYVDTSAQQTPALTVQAPQQARGMAALRERVGVKASQVVEVQPEPFTLTPHDPADECPVCGVVNANLRGQMDAQRGCPDCNGVAL